MKDFTDVFGNCFSKAGTFLTFFDDRSKAVVSHEIKFQSQTLCPKHVSLQHGFSQDKFLLSFEETLVSLEHHKINKGMLFLLQFTGVCCNFIKIAAF